MLTLVTKLQHTLAIIETKGQLWHMVRQGRKHMAPLLTLVTKLQHTLAIYETMGQL